MLSVPSVLLRQEIKISNQFIAKRSRDTNYGDKRDEVVQKDKGNILDGLKVCDDKSKLCKLYIQYTAILSTI